MKIEGSKSLVLSLGPTECEYVPVRPLKENYIVALCSVKKAKPKVGGSLNCGAGVDRIDLQRILVNNSETSASEQLSGGNLGNAFCECSSHGGRANLAQMKPVAVSS